MPAIEPEANNLSQPRHTTPFYRPELSGVPRIHFSVLSYRFFESPFLRRKEKFARVGSRPV